MRQHEARKEASYWSRDWGGGLGVSGGAEGGQAKDGRYTDGGRRDGSRRGGAGRGRDVGEG